MKRFAKFPSLRFNKNFKCNISRFPVVIFTNEIIKIKLSLTIGPEIVCSVSGSGAPSSIGRIAMWFPLTGDERLGRCATEHCGGQPTWRLEAEGQGSNYCSGCKEAAFTYDRDDAVKHATWLRSLAAQSVYNINSSSLYKIANGLEHQAKKIEQLQLAMTRARRLIGGMNDNAPQDVKQSNINLAWHILDNHL